MSDFYDENGDFDPIYESQMASFRRLLPLAMGSIGALFAVLFAVLLVISDLESGKNSPVQQQNKAISRGE